MTQARDVTATFNPAAQTPADSTPPPDETVQPRNPPVVAVKTERLRVSRRGYVRVPLKCKKSGTDKCVGVVRIRARLPAEATSAAKELRTIGHHSFRIDVGDTKRVRFRLTRRARRLVREDGELVARVVVLAEDSEGKTHKFVRKVTLRPARPAT